MNTETTNWNTQEWNTTEVEDFIYELKKYHNSDNQQVFTICESPWEHEKSTNSITVSIPTSPTNSDLNVIWKAELKFDDGEEFYQVHEISMFKQIMKATNPNGEYFWIIANF
ncbi:MAG: hypothetical protein CL756_05030 [Chloroflexi bacterium]|nr:hypothetical protein [Chloroflexota bacterium]|tara:strand:- start:45 stop:380 length:336 start_codon:yes stop_codon:yes gene_type:complete